MFINELSDYPSIKKLALALHRLDASQHGASIMVGAGFSRSAARHVDGKKKMPLWGRFTEKLVAELNPNDHNSRFSDPLRIAEEYRAYFGQAALNDRIRSEIDNDAWKAGELYQVLLELPWQEVMTTNWDTLLERAAKNIIQGPYYTPVTKTTDLTWATSPRIVKLHGTIGVTDSYIAAQEDYRTYSEKFAPFVNFARQTFIENELCLIGFSGDDPNFLHWAGWIRDHLTHHARKIYLVGALKLSAARRKHLESINIAPIDLWGAVKEHEDDSDLMHQKAAEIFLQALIDEGKSRPEPHKWSPSNLLAPGITQEDRARQHREPEYVAAYLKAQLEPLKRDRESYPGWLVCPSQLQQLIRYQLSAPYPTAKNIAALEPNDRNQLLYEIAWRYSITFEYIPAWMIAELAKISNPDIPCNISKQQQLEIALVLLKNSRWLIAHDNAGREEIQLHINELIAILKKHEDNFLDCRAEVAYHQALVARDNLDYASMELLSEEITGEDEAWKLRKAALLMELGRFDEGARLITDAYRELQERYRYDQNSISILSRLAWADYLLRAATEYQADRSFRPLPATIKDWRCDPWTWIERIREGTRKREEDYIRNQNPIEPLFDQGYYRDNSNHRPYNNDTSEFFLLDGLTRNAGIPLRSGSAFMGVSLLSDVAEKLVLSGGVGNEPWNYTLAIRAASSEDSPSIKWGFTRIGVACASQTVVDTFITRILEAITYWRKKRSNGTSSQQGYALSALRVLIEVLARLAIRATPEKAKDIFQLSTSLAKQINLQHPWLFDAMDSLLSYSLQSVPEFKQGELLTEALMFPLQGEVMLDKFPRWPNPVIYHPYSRETYPNIDKRINELINLVTSTGTVSTTPALLRLLPLVEAENFLTQSELDKLADALWGSPPNYQDLPNTGLSPHALLILPAPDASEVKALVCRNLYENAAKVLEATRKDSNSYPSPEIEQAVTVFDGMANAAANKKVALFPTQEQALILFNLLMEWSPHPDKVDPLGAIIRRRKQLTESIGNAISYAIVPALSTDDKSRVLFNKLQKLYDNVEGITSALPAFVYFAYLDKDTASSIEKCVEKALLNSNNRIVVGYAATALLAWADLPNAADSPNIKNLISRIIGIIELGRTTGLQRLLLVAGEIFNKELLSTDQIKKLIEVIPNIFNASDYENIQSNSREAISASTIRESCVKLANMLIAKYPSEAALKEIISRSSTDALPEVRFAININAAV